jgi:hypothetical protein
MDDGSRQYKFVYRLVADAFVPGKTDVKWSVNHIDGKTIIQGHLDDRAPNLEWSSMDQQHTHALETGLKANGEKLSQLTENQVIDILNRLSLGEKQIDIASRYGVSQAQVSAISTGRSWSHLSGREQNFQPRHYDYPPPVGEDWKPVVGCRGYWVARTGKIWSSKSQRLLQTTKPNKDKRYVKVNMTTDEGKSKGFLVHRLVAEAFIPKADGCCVVNHINGFSNDASNLEWTTDLANQEHAKASGLQTKPRLNSGERVVSS